MIQRSPGRKRHPTAKLYPLRLLEQMIRRTLQRCPTSSIVGSSGTGQHRGGKGTVQFRILVKQEDEGSWTPFFDFPHSQPSLGGGGGGVRL